MRGVWRSVWAFLKELSGEAALERRLAAHGGCAHDRARAIAHVLEEDYEGRPRCC